MRFLVGLAISTVMMAVCLWAASGHSGWGAACGVLGVVIEKVIHKLYAKEGA